MRILRNLILLMMGVFVLAGCGAKQDGVTQEEKRRAIAIQPSAANLMYAPSQILAEPEDKK